MSTKLSCSCGKKFKVEENKAGKHIRCSECGKRLYVSPELFEEEADEELPAAPFPKGKGRGECAVCGDVEQGATYYYYTGADVGIRLKNVVKHGLFLCRSCAVSQWRKKYLFDCLVPGLFMLVSFMGTLAGLLFVEHDELRKGIVISTLVIGALISLIVLMDLWKVFVPTLYRPTMEYIAVDLAKKMKGLIKKKDTVLTAEEFRLLTRPDDGR